MEELLMEVHAFLDCLGVDEVRQRGSQDDKPLRMVKTLLHELCKALVCASINLLCVGLPDTALDCLLLGVSSLALANQGPIAKALQVPGSADQLFVSALCLIV